MPRIVAMLVGHDTLAIPTRHPELRSRIVSHRRILPIALLATLAAAAPALRA